ncbi:hypothetical protein LAZ67_14001248 [Cordylochernes scorpioides]|uniref:Uncharacterized protein n=1 Tax=Cordylochernes scorpioides TaxID=51811 RepID=A0ABY6L728_9ARAC|nr:hypothetical protein LAZ67_14001248 [Cordylochernes scorpioides]
MAIAHVGRSLIYAERYQLIEKQDVIFTKVGGSNKRPHDPDHAKSAIKKGCVQAPGIPLNSSRSRATPRPILVGLSSVQLADKLIEEGLNIKDLTLRAFPLMKRAERIVLGNVLFFVEGADLVTALRPYGQVTFIIQKMIQLEDSCWADARREAFITLRVGVKLSQIPAQLDVKGVVMHVYVTDGIKCSLCYKQGHKCANCPRKTGLQEDKLVLPHQLQLHQQPHLQTITCCSGHSPTSIKGIQCSAGPDPQGNPYNERSKSLEPKTSRKRRQGPVSRPPSSKPMPSNNSAFSTPAAELSAPIKQTPSTVSSPAAPTPGANFPVRPYETPAPELPVPAPSTSQMPSRPEPSSTNTEPLAAPAEEIQAMTESSIQSATPADKNISLSQAIQEREPLNNFFEQLKAYSTLAPLYGFQVDYEDVVSAENHLLGILEREISRWSPYVRGFSLVGRARAANSLVLAAVLHHLHGYLPGDAKIAKLQARLTRFLACFKGVQAACRAGGKNAYSWLLESGAWMAPLSSGSWLLPRRRRLLDLWEQVSSILSLNHRVVPTPALMNLPLVGACRFLATPSLRAPSRWVGVRVRDLAGPATSLTTRLTRSTCDDAAALGSFCCRLVAENAGSSHQERSLEEAVVLRGTATPFLRISTRTARRMLERPRLAAVPISRYLRRWAPVVDVPSTSLAFSSLRRCSFGAMQRTSLCGWPCTPCLIRGTRRRASPAVRPLIREVFSIIGRPPDLQSWIFAVDLENHAITISSAAKHAIYVFFVDREMRGVAGDPLAVFHQTLQRPGVLHADGSGDLSLAHRYWSCRQIRPVIVETFTIIQQPPDLQSWIFGHGLEVDALAILASAKARIYRHFLTLELRGVQGDPLLVWRRTLSRWATLLQVQNPHGHLQGDEMLQELTTNQ